MWFNELSEEDYLNSIIAVAISYGKDSLTTLHVLIDILKWRVDLAYTTDIWFDDDTPADLPEVWEFKQKMDELIFNRYGLKVQHFCAMRGGAEDNFSRHFQTKRENGRFTNNIIGFPLQQGSWCKKLKYEEVDIQGYILSCYEAEREWGGYRIYGYPIINGEWCRSYLKTNQRIPNLNQSRELVYGTQDKCFLKAPKRGAV